MILACQATGAVSIAVGVAMVLSHFYVYKTRIFLEDSKVGFAEGAIVEREPLRTRESSPDGTSHDLRYVYEVNTERFEMWTGAIEPDRFIEDTVTIRYSLDYPAVHEIEPLLAEDWPSESSLLMEVLSSACLVVTGLLLLEIRLATDIVYWVTGNPRPWSNVKRNMHHFLGALTYLLACAVFINVPLLQGAIAKVYFKFLFPCAFVSLGLLIVASHQLDKK